MPRLVKSQILNIPQGKVYELITNFSSKSQNYINIHEGIVVKSTKEQNLIEYNFNLIKDYSYTLNYTKNNKVQINWTLEKSNIFNKFTGSWSVLPVSDTSTKVTYFAEIDFKVFTPNIVANRLLHGDLKNVLCSLKEKVNYIEN
jgi:ribosome-associated toxin RatA of RatAB toxin-antitoxin module